MILHLTPLDPSVLAPMVIGILTIFGRGKKKDGKGEEDQLDRSSTGRNVDEQDPSAIAASPTPPEPTTMGVNSSAPSTTPEESSLNKLLQSLLQDIPFAPPPENESNPVPASTPDWVPPRATPPSRPMVIVPGDKGNKVLAPTEPEQPTTAPKNARPSEPEQRSTPVTLKPSPLPVQRVEQLEHEVKKSSKLEKQEVKQETPKTPAGTRQSFEHIFDLTQGTLRSPGLVIINGPVGSGKTSVSTSLAGSYLKSGLPCLFVTYDQSPTSLREMVKQAGWDAGQYESQFRLLLVDGFSGQSDSLSFEPYYVERPFDMTNLEETLLRNTQVFLGDKLVIIFDSLTGLASQASPKEFLNKFRDVVDKLRGIGAILVLTVDLGKVSKDIAGPMEDMAACVVDLKKDGQNGGQLRVRRLNGSVSKSEPEGFEIEAGKGLLFV